MMRIVFMIYQILYRCEMCPKSESLGYDSLKQFAIYLR